MSNISSKLSASVRRTRPTTGGESQRQAQPAKSASRPKVSAARKPDLQPATPTQPVATPAAAQPKPAPVVAGLELILGRVWPD